MCCTFTPKTTKKKTTSIGNKDICECIVSVFRLWLLLLYLLTDTEVSVREAALIHSVQKHTLTHIYIQLLAIIVWARLLAHINKSMSLDQYWQTQHYTIILYTYIRTWVCVYAYIQTLTLTANFIISNDLIPVLICGASAPLNCFIYVAKRVYYVYYKHICYIWHLYGKDSVHIHKIMTKKKKIIKIIIIMK